MTTDRTFTVTETDDTITRSARLWDDQFRDRLNYDRQAVLTKAINAWRQNTIARRIIELTTQFVVGDGFGFSTKNLRLRNAIGRFWNDPLNDLDQQIPEWADEAWRTGDLFLLFSVDAGGAPYVRAIPTEQITEVVTLGNDYRQELAYKRSTLYVSPLPACDPQQEQESFVLHFPLNRPVGASFGVADLSPLLYWITLHRQWLEHRARLALNAGLFTYVVTHPFASSAEQEQYANLPNTRLNRKPGSVLTLNDNDTITPLMAGLQSYDSAEDGLAMKKMIAAGAGIPIHYLAEPESSTRTTAESAGTPAIKRFKSRQVYLRHALRTVILAALAVQRRTNPHLPLEPELEITTPDISERDNALLAIAAQRVVNAFAPPYNARLIDSTELLRLVYRFIGETPLEPAPVKFIALNLRGSGPTGMEEEQRDDGL